VRFLLAGGLNTLFGFSAANFIYFLLHDKINLTSILIYSHVINVTFSFFIQKYFVFRASGNIIKQYLKAHFVNIVNFFINSFFIWIFVKKFFFVFWASLLITSFISIAFLYFLHMNFTFKGVFDEEDN
jgi:putative flippase GtrA